MVLGRRHLFFRRRPLVGHKVQQRCGFLISIERHVDRQVTRGHALFHLHHFFFFHPQVLGQQLGLGREAFRLQPLFFPLQVEEELALGLGGTELDHPPVVHEVADDIGPDPPHGIGRKAHAPVRIKVTHRLHEANIAFLDQV